MKKTIDYEVALPHGVQATLDGRDLIVKGPKGETRRTLLQPGVSIVVEGTLVRVKAVTASKREKRHAGSISAHIKNMIEGVQTPFQFKLKVCASHFPMNVSVQGNKLVVKNFLGEKIPREIMFDKGASVKVAGDIIEVESCDIELAGTTASKFENLTFVSKRDRRIFQDGIYVTHKPGVDA